MFGLIRCILWRIWDYLLCKSFLFILAFSFLFTQEHIYTAQLRKYEKTKKENTLNGYLTDKDEGKKKWVEGKPIIRHGWWWTTYNSGVKDHHHHQLYCAQFNADKKSGYDKTCMERWIRIYMCITALRCTIPIYVPITFWVTWNFADKRKLLNTFKANG